MVTLDQIAHAMNETRETLRSNDGRDRNDSLRDQWAVRREFIRKAFMEAHTPEAIGEYLDRSQIMVQHALRMIAVEELHADYGQTLAELRFRLTGDGA